MTPLSTRSRDAIADDYERSFALFVMLAGTVCALTILVVVTFTDVAPMVEPGAAAASLGCLVGLGLARTGRWELGFRVMMWTCALAIGPSAAAEPSGEAALSAALSWLLMGVFASLLLTRTELYAMGVACTAATAALVGYVQILDIAPTLQPGGVLATVFVAVGYATLAQIASHFRDSLARTRDAEHAAKEALQARGRFLANMSHELRTPLNAIIGYSELLMDDVEREEAREDLRRIHWSGSTLLGHINAMLDLSKLEAGHMEIHAEHVDLVDLIDDVVGQHRPLIAGRGNDAVVEVEPGLAVSTDRQKLLQILTNLLTNANKFTEDGEVRVRGRRTPDDIVVEVIDTGIGMDDEALARIFQPFMQADSSTTRLYGGTGLGLALVHRFADLLGGRVEVESQPGVGSTFRVHLPLEPPERLTPAPAPRA